MLETRLLRCLRRWSANPDATDEDRHRLHQEICGLLEFYICDCISYGPKNLGGWWSDGVIHLEITERGSGRFALLGVTWIGALGIAPFEIDVELDPNDDSHFAKTIFRIGSLDNHGLPIVAAPNLAPSRVLETRPPYNRNWAMAIELTPHKNAAEQSDPPKPSVGRELQS